MKISLRCPECESKVVRARTNGTCVCIRCGYQGKREDFKEEKK